MLSTIGNDRKRILRDAAAVLLLVAVRGGAQDEVRKVEAGVVMWAKQWKHHVPGTGSITSDSTVLFGPAIEVKFPNHFFVDASYLFSLSDYTFSSNAIYNVERQDANAAI